MSHIVRHPTWAVIDLDTNKGHVLVREGWRYNWTVDPGASPWTLVQKRHFHNTMDQQIWQHWSHRTRIQMAGGDPIVHRFPSGLTVTFDVQWVLSGGDWTVNVRKLAPGGALRANVDYTNRTVNLQSDNLSRVTAINDAKVTRPFYVTPHEFGHTIYAPDEYKTGNAHLGDAESIMNVGRQIRPRHFAELVAELNKMIPGVAFSV